MSTAMSTVGTRFATLLCAALCAVTVATLDGCQAPPAEGEGEPECSLDADCTTAGELCADDGTCQACQDVLGLPTPNAACLPLCGNSLGVGMPCTAGGGQCNGNDVHALFCTIDQVPDAELHMCTGPCGQDSDCGEDAVCTGDPADPQGPKGCVPAACND